MYTLIKQCQYDVLRTLRNRQSIVFTILMPLFFYFLFLRVNGGANSLIAGTTWKTYFLMSMASFSVVGACLFGLSSRIAFERSQGWLRLVQTTPMRYSTYVMTKCLSQVLICCVTVAVLFLVGAVSQGVHLKAVQWLISLVWLTLGALPFITLGLLIGVLVSVEAANIVCNVLNLGLGIMGGLWFPTTIMPKAMQAVAVWTPTYRFAHVAWNNVAGHSVQFEDIGVTVAYTVVFAALALWALRRQEEHES